MKLAKIFVLAAFLSASAFADNAGTIIVDAGKHLKNEHGKVVHKQLKKGNKIPKHAHKNDEVMFFAVLEGKIAVVLNDSATYELNAGDVLKFHGSDEISAEALDETRVLVTFIKE